MKNNTLSNREQGVVGLALLGVIVVVLVALAFIFVMRAQKQDEPAKTTTAENNGSSTLSRNARNTQRVTDVSNLLGATTEFVNNNSGNLPSDFSDGQVVGQVDQNPVRVPFKFYTSASVVQGEHPPLTEDSIRLVLGAACAEDGSTVNSSRRATAVQYGFEEQNGRFSGKCKDG